MKTRRTLKGFTVPPGYTLNITQDDGEVITKQPGENSGSHYSFQEVLEGVDPDWELVQTGGAEPQTVGQQMQGMIDITDIFEQPQVEEPPANKVTSFDLVKRNYDHLDPEVVDILDGISDKDLWKLAMNPKVDKDNLTVESLLASGVEITTSEEAEEEILELEFNLQLALETDKEISISKLLGSTLADYYEMSNRAKKNYAGMGLDNMISQVVEQIATEKEVETYETKYQFVTGLAETEEDFEPALTYDEVPEVDSPEQLIEQLGEFKNPHNVQLLLSKAAANADIPIEPVFFEDKFRESDNPKELVDEAWKAYNNPYSQAIRNYISENSNYEWGAEQFEERFGVSESYMRDQGYTEQQMEAFRFPLSFLHPQFGNNLRGRDRYSVSVSRIPEGTRAHVVTAGGHHEIRMPRGDLPGVFAHEASHVVESTNAEELIGLNVLPFLLSRVKPEEESILLYETNDEDEDSSEGAFRDSFILPYTGKVYFDPYDEEGYSSHEHMTVDQGGMYLGDIVRTSKVNGTEVLSIGMQRMYDNPLKFAREEPGFFRFMWKLRTNPRLFAREEDE